MGAKAKKYARIISAVATVAVIAACIIAVPLAVFLTGIFLPAQFGETYYGELSAMYSRLKTTEGKKIVFIGNSNIAFGVDSALIEDELALNGYNYTVCNFGLYGALGTKLMLDLSQDYIGEGDIVIFIPEIGEQSLSLYFSAEETWRALDGDLSMVFDVSSDDKSSLAGNFAGYVTEKYSYYISGEIASSGTVYAKASFDDRCDMKNASREYNTMNGGYDANNLVSFDVSLLDDDFISYVNDYYSVIKSRGAEMYFSFAPVNSSGLASTDEEIDEFCQTLSYKLNFSIMSNPHSYVMESGWFYDSNVHLNSSGMMVRTARLTEDILNLFGCTAKLSYSLPEIPQVPETSAEGEGDNTYADYFTYSEDDTSCTITGLTDEGKGLTSIIVPYSHNGKVITSFTADTFSGNEVIEQITLQDNITYLADYSFTGCTALTEIILEQTDPEKISVGFNLLDGADNCCLYVPSSALSAYSNNYFWGHYMGQLAASGGE